MCTHTSATHSILSYVPHLPHLFLCRLQVRYLLYTSYQKIGDMLRGRAASGEVRGRVLGREEVRGERFPLEDEGAAEQRRHQGGFSVNSGEVRGEVRAQCYQQGGEEVRKGG